MDKDTFENIRNEGRLLYEYIRGSQSHGLATETSDVDTGGIYIASFEKFCANEVEDTIADEKNDNSWFELGKFMELIAKSNPNALEALFIPDECVLYETSLFKKIKEHREEFLSKECLFSFGGYAIAQIKRARGLNKMITMPDNMERKTPLDFCYVAKHQGSTNFENWLRDHNMKQENCGLVHLPNMPGMYGVYYDETGTKGYKGVIKDNSNELRLTSIEKGVEPVVIMSYNESGYTKHCIDYKHWKEWKENRNPVRYQSNLHKNYDAKNMCESFRLVTMAIEIANGDGFNCDRRNIDREFLLSIKNHKYEYDELMNMLQKKEKELVNVMANTSLKDVNDKELVKKILVSIRKDFYLGEYTKKLINLLEKI